MKISEELPAVEKQAVFMHSLKELQDGRCAEVEDKQEGSGLRGEGSLRFDD